MRKEIIQRVFEKGIDLNVYTILLKAKNQEDFLTLLSIRKIEGIINLMVKRNYLTEDKVITEKGKLLLEEIGYETVTVIEEIVTSEKPFEEWTTKMLAKIKSKLKEIIGKEQQMGFGNVYFVPGIYDLRSFLIRFAKDYNTPLLPNKDAIEDILLRHVIRCAKTQKFSPAIKYFIIKDKTGSQLATALENYSKVEESEEIKQKIEVKNIKDLF